MNTNAKEAILQTAYDLFSQHGFSGTSIKMIADELDLSTSLIFHHFKSKEALWVEVERFAIESQKQPAHEVRQDSLDNFLSDILDFRLKWYHDEKFRKFFHWRSLEKNIQELAELAKTSEHAAKLSILNVPDYVKQAQKKGLIKKELDPQVVATLIFSNSSYAIWDYADYYNMTDAQLEVVKALVLQALTNILKP